MLVFVCMCVSASLYYNITVFLCGLIVTKLDMEVAFIISALLRNITGICQWSRSPIKICSVFPLFWHEASPKMVATNCEEKDLIESL